MVVFFKTNYLNYIFYRKTLVLKLFKGQQGPLFQQISEMSSIKIIYQTKPS